ncbi:hypothetical protein C8D87_1021233 [Lentzea atacamensis]|uniref:Uncharacterized protein n=1 Tax=Lentzea atacamensis TaxID=531938 RepID=A0ABX9EIG3_9PSEU|nr:hypothetical protein C8D87_1021233 [Lentzea atacamensis]
MLLCQTELQPQWLVGFEPATRPLEVEVTLCFAPDTVKLCAPEIKFANGAFAF